MNHITISKKQRFILVKIAQLTIVFPAELVAEIGIIEQNKIMILPFYNDSLKGCIYYNGKIIPLVDLKTVFQLDYGVNRDKMILVCLSEKAAELAGVGLIFDQVLGSKYEQELPQELWNNNQENMKLFNLEMLDKNIWELQDYYS